MTFLYNGCIELKVKTKSEIRKEILNIRNNLDSEFVVQKSRIIIDKIKATEEYKNSKSIMVYMDFKSEVNTKDFVNEALSEGKKIIIPYTDVEKVLIIPVEIESLDDLIACKFGYLEPRIEKISNQYDIEKIDLIIVPGVAFDKKRNRVGFGKGYYDRLLISRKAKAFAIAYEFQVLEEVPAQEHDIKMDMIITEENIYQ